MSRNNTNGLRRPHSTAHAFRHLKRRKTSRGFAAHQQELTKHHWHSCPPHRPRSEPTHQKKNTGTAIAEAKIYGTRWNVLSFFGTYPPDYRTVTANGPSLRLQGFFCNRAWKRTFTSALCVPDTGSERCDLAGMSLTWALDAFFFLNLRPLVGFCSICLVSFRVSCFCSRASAIILVISGGKTYHDLPCLFPKNDSLYRCVDTYTCREYFSDFQPTRVEPDRPKATSLKHWDDAVGSPAHHSTECFVKSFHFHPSVRKGSRFLQANWACGFSVST